MFVAPIALGAVGLGSPGCSSAYQMSGKVGPTPLVSVKEGAVESA